MFISLLGALLYYLYVYALFSQYAQGKTLTTITFSNWQPFYVRLSPRAALLSLEWLMVSAVVYLVLDYGISLARQSYRRHAARSKS